MNDVYISPHHGYLYPVAHQRPLSFRPPFPIAAISGVPCLSVTPPDNSMLSHTTSTRPRGGLQFPASPLGAEDNLLLPSLLTPPGAAPQDNPVSTALSASLFPLEVTNPVAAPAAPPMTASSVGNGGSSSSALAPSALVTSAAAPVKASTSRPSSAGTRAPFSVVSAATLNSGVLLVTRSTPSSATKPLPLARASSTAATAAVRSANTVTGAPAGGGKKGSLSDANGTCGAGASQTTVGTSVTVGAAQSARQHRGARPASIAFQSAASVLEWVAHAQPLRPPQPPVAVPAHSDAASACVDTLQLPRPNENLGLPPASGPAAAAAVATSSSCDNAAMSIGVAVSDASAASAPLTAVFGPVPPHAGATRAHEPTVPTDASSATCPGFEVCESACDASTAAAAAIPISEPVASAAAAAPAAAAECGEEACMSVAVLRECCDEEHVTSEDYNFTEDHGNDNVREEKEKKEETENAGTSHGESRSSSSEAARGDSMSDTDPACASHHSLVPSVAPPLSLLPSRYPSSSSSSSAPTLYSGASTSNTTYFPVPPALAGTNPCTCTSAAAGAPGTGGRGPGGRLGVLKHYNDASRYEGEVCEATRRRCGKGRYRNEKGDEYRGEWGDDARHGQGKYEWASGDCYEGEWVRDTIHGQGKFTWACGEVYEGQWERGLMQGHGRRKMLNGDVYVGDWVANQSHGHGKKVRLISAAFSSFFKLILYSLTINHQQSTTHRSLLRVMSTKAGTPSTSATALASILGRAVTVTREHGSGDISPAMVQRFVAFHPSFSLLFYDS